MGKHKNQGVEWTLPNTKRPFAYSTKATSDLIAILYEQHKDLRIVYDEINYDDDAKRIVKHFIDNGFYQANISY